MPGRTDADTRILLSYPLKVIAANTTNMALECLQVLSCGWIPEPYCPTNRCRYQHLATIRESDYCNPTYMALGCVQIHTIESQSRTVPPPPTDAHANILPSSAKAIAVSPYVWKVDTTLYMLITTDALAHGKDIPDVDIVIIYDFPRDKDPSLFLQMVGRALERITIFISWSELSAIVRPFFYTKQKSASTIRMSRWRFESSALPSRSFALLELFFVAKHVTYAIRPLTYVCML